MAFSNTQSSGASIRRQKQIEDCLLDNLQQRPYTSVSISDMCHQLNISRKSFYNYFPDKDSCFRSVISRKLRQCSLAINDGLPEDAGTEDMVIAYLNFVKSQRSFWDIIIRNNLLILLIDQSIHFIRDEDKSLLKYLNTPQLETDEFVLASYVTLQITMMLQWYQHNFEISVEEMAGKYDRLVHQPLISLPKEL